jgi:TP901 family phage tail tape measure protein
MAKTFPGLRIPIGLDFKAWDKSISKFQKEVGKIGKTFSNVGSNLTVGLTLPIAGAATAVVKFAMDFEKGMSNIATLIPGNTQRIKELGRSVQDMAVQTGKSTDDLTEGLYQVVSAFGDSADTVKVLEINAKAAAAGMATTTDAINLTSAVTKGYGDTSAKAVQKASDLAFQTVKLGQTTFPELASSMGKVIPVAAQLGIKQEELFAVFATGTGVTGSAAEVTTQLRGALVGLQKPSEEMTVALQTLGFNSGEAALESLGLKGTLDALKTTTGGNVNEMVKLFGSTESWALVSALAGSQSDVFASKLQSMNKSVGATEEAFGEVSKTTAFTFAQLQQQLVTTGQQLGEALAPVLLTLLNEYIKPLIERIKQWATAFQNADKETKTMIVGLVALLAAIGPISSAVGVMITAFKALLVIMTPLVLKVAAVTAAVIALAASIYYLYDNWGSILKRLKLEWISWTMAIMDGTDAIIKAMSYMQQVFGGPMVSVVGEATNAALKFKQGMGDMADTAPMKTFSESMGGITDSIVEKFNSMKEAAADFLFGTQAAASGAAKAVEDFSLRIGVKKQTSLQTPGAAPVAQAATAIPLTMVSGEGLGQIDAAEQRLMDFAENISSQVGPMITQGLADIGSTFIEMSAAVAMGSGSFGDVFNSVLMMLADLAVQVGKIAIGTAIAISGIKLALESLNPVAAFAAGVALIALGGAVKGALSKAAKPKSGGNTPRLAKGGLAYGPTMAVVGDNPGAKSDPEVIAPLSKLRNMIGNQSQTINVPLYLDGRLVATATANANRVKGR